MRWEEKFLHACYALQLASVVALRSNKVRDALEIRTKKPAASYFAGQIAGTLLGVCLVHRLPRR